MMKSNSLTNRILALVLTLVMVLGMMPSGFTSADAVSAGLMVYIDPLDEWIEKGYTLKVWSGGDARYPTDDNGDGIYNFQLPSGWTAFELVVSDEESGYDYIYYTNDMEIPTDDRNLYTAESVVMVNEVLGEITGSWSVYTPKSYTTVYFKPLQEWIDAGYRFNFSETPHAEFHFFTDADGDGIYEVSLDSELVDRWRDGSYLHIQVREAGEDGWYSYKCDAQVKMPNDGSNLFTATALDEVYQHEMIGTWSVYTPAGTPPAETYVAEVNGTKYETLAGAVAAAAPGETVKLLGDASGAGVVINKNITIDFGGFTYTFTEGVGSTGTESNGFQILSGNTVTLKNGTLNVAAESAGKFYMLIQNYANLTVTNMTLDGTNLDKWSATDGDSYALSINSGNVVLDGVNFYANNDGDKAFAFDVCDHASYAGAPTVTVKNANVDGKVDVSAIGNSTFSIEGGQFADNSLIGYVVYGKTMDETGKVITDTVIDTERELRDAIAKGGEVTLGADITLTGPVTVDKAVTLNLNGFTLTLPEHNNYAIVVKNSLTINGEGNVVVKGLYGIGLSTACTGGLTVNGGNITGANADYLIGAFNGKVTINGGTLTAAYCVLNSFDGYNATAEVKGGTLSAEYPVLGVNVAVSGTAALNIGDFLCVNGDNYYNDLATAIADAASGDKIILLADGEGPGAVIDKELEIDFDGHTYLFTEGVGSKGTESNGFQILAGADVALRDGKLGVAESAKDQFYILLQNYGRLSVAFMTLDGTNLDKWSATDGDSYTLSINSGDVAVGFTTIIANDQGDKAYAFDVCDHPSYEGAPFVDVHGNSQIEGKVDLTAFGDSHLHTHDSHFYGEVDISKLTEDSDVEFDEGCTFVNDISAYVAEDMAAVYEGGKYVVKLLQQNFKVEAAPESLVYKAGLTHQINATGSDTTAPITYTVTEGNATVDESGLVTVSGVGTVKITVAKAGDDTYAPASYEYTFEVTKGVSAIEAENVSLTFGVTAFTNTVTTVGDGKITYAITGNSSGVAVAIDETTGALSFDNTVDKVGTFTVLIAMAEGENYQATSATYTVTLNYAETPETPYTFNAEINDNGWYEIGTLLVEPAKGYQICMLDPETGKLGTWSANPLSFKNGVYENITVYLKDVDGNITAPIAVGTLKVDNVAPAAKIEIVNPVVETIINKIFFVTKEDVTVKITVDDTTSGIADTLVSLDGGKSFESIGAVKEYILTFDADYRDAIQIKVTDNAGLETVVDSPYVIVVDKTNPLFATAEFVKYDAVSNEIYFDDGNDFVIRYVVNENNLDLHDKTLTVTINGKEEVWTLSDVGMVEKALTDEGVYRIVATFVDVANNTPATDTKDYVVDNAAPVITLDLNGLTEIVDVYYTSNKGYGLPISIDESLYDVYLAHGIEPEVTVNGEKVTLDWNKPAATLNLFDEGVYEIVVTYDNLVYEPVSETINIVVDHNEPVITLTPDIKQIQNDIYYTDKENYGLKITLTEELYDYYYGLGFEPVVTVNGVETKLDWSKPEATLNLPDNGVYEIVVSYCNCWQAVADQAITIVVDHEEPVITLTPDIDLVEKGVYYTAKENYELAISLTEDLYDHYLSCGIKPVVTVNGKEVELDWTTTATKLALPDNGVYEIEVSYGHYLHTAEKQSIKIVVDHEVPVITLTPDITEIQNSVYYTDKENYELAISLNEDLFDYYLSCGIKPVVTVNGKEVELDWTTTETKLTLPDNGVYAIEVTYGHYLHTAEKQSIKIVVDHEVPVIELLHGISEDVLVDGIYYTNDENYKLTIHLTEDLYDHYLNDCKIAPVVTVNGTVKELEWNKTKDEAVLEAILPLTEDGVYEIKVTYGHYLHTAEEKNITICRDIVKPEVSIEYRGAESKGTNHVGETVFADAVTAVIIVKDVNFDQNSVELVVTPSNAVGETKTYTASWTEVSDDVWECALPLDVAADYDITFSCQDHADNGNSTAADLAVDIDELPDNYKFAYSTSVHGEILENLTLGFWRNQLTVTVDVVDDVSGIQFVEASWNVAEDAYKDGNKDGSFTKEELEVKTVEETPNGYRVTFLVPKDLLGDENQVNGYITVVTYDYAGNTSTATDDVRVIADNIAPTRTVNETAPVNVVDNVKYFNGDIVLKANIFEANYRFHNDAIISIIKDGKAYNEPGHVTGWYKGDANATSTITLTEDGDYVVTITYTDGSGNKMIDYSSGNLTLDTKAPVITVSNIKQDSANKDETYGFTITVNDINLDVATVKPVLTAVVRGEDGLYSTVEIDLGEAKVSEDNQTVTYTVENLEEDALYKLTCSAEDMSDNLCNVIVLEDGKSYETVNFSINRNGSTYGFGNEYMSNLVNQYYVYAVYEDLIIEEVNVDPIENYVVTVNGKELVEGTDYTTAQESKEGQWSKRTYTIHKSYFDEEGEYNVIVSSTDKAETTAYSDIKDLAIAFVVDQTAPILTISGLQSGGRYQTDEQTVTLIPTDEGGRLNSLKVVVMDSNGTPITDENGNDVSVRFDISGEELLDYLAENGDMVTFTVPSGLEQQVKIVCTDCAVNEYGVTNEYNGTFSRVTVSQNALVIFYANKPVFFGTLGGVAVLILLIVLLLKKKKNGKK